jgi:hypothetical protein
MSTEFNVIKTTGVTGVSYASVMGRGEPVAQPQNCNEPGCPYGYGRAFCFPCYAKILEGSRKRGEEHGELRS